MTNAWMTSEIRILREFYPLIGQQIAAKLPRHSIGSIRSTASRLRLSPVGAAASLRWRLTAESYFIARAAHGVAAAQRRFTVRTPER